MSPACSITFCVVSPRSSRLFGVEHIQLVVARQAHALDVGDPVLPPERVIASTSVSGTSLMASGPGDFTSPVTCTFWLRNDSTRTSTCGLRIYGTSCASTRLRMSPTVLPAA